MGNDQKYIPPALNAVVIKGEDPRLRAPVDSTDPRQKKSIEMLRPLLAALDALREKVGPGRGVEISVPPASHMGSVTILSVASYQRFSILTTLDNSMFEIEYYSSFLFDFPSEKKYLFPDPESALAMVVEAVGAYINSTK